MKKLSYLFFITLFFLNLIMGYAFSSDAKEAVLFLDVNNNPLEINVAKKAAFQKGQRLVVYPEGKNQVTEEGLKAVFSENKFSSLTISGHSGGMSFHGEKGSVDLPELTKIMKESSSKDAVESLYLLGCNTGNKAKVLFWKDSLPNLKFIAGYDGIAPLGHNQRGLDLYGDALKKEASIINTQSVAQFKKVIESIQNIKNFPISLYAICGESGGEFLYRPKNVDGEKFAEFNLEDCLYNKEKYNKEIYPEIQQFMTGELEPTTLNPSNGRLREIYVFARQNEHCFTEYDYNTPDGDALLHLRFMKDFNINFATYYKDDFYSLKTEVDQLIKDPEDFFNVKERSHERSAALLDQMLEDPEVFEENFGPLKFYYETEMQMHKSSLEYGHCLKDDLSLFDSGIFGGACATNAEQVADYSLMKSKLESLRDRKSFLTDLKNRLNAHRIKDVNAIKDKVDLQAMAATLEKMQKTPEQLTRKEILVLDEQFLRLRHEIPVHNANKLGDFLTHYRKIDSQAYPFSWHEAPGKEGVERPTTSTAVSGLSRVSMRIPWQLRVLTSEIEFNTLDLSGF